MADIVLATFNARYHHAVFGLRYLKANLGTLQERCTIVEFDLEKRPADALETILAHEPRIVGLGVYIWNTRQCLEFARMLKAVRPDIRLVIGGPEVSYELADQPLAALADHVICGEADLAFAKLCRELLDGRTPEKVIEVPPVDLPQVAMPYPLYSDEDLAHRTIYVESSRGCPFSCEFCLSSLDIPVRRFELALLLAEMQLLLDRNCRHFKFVDRTFNVQSDHACAVLRFFLERLKPGILLHFEMVPDHLPEAVRDLLREFPAGSLQLEIGVQSFDPEVTLRIGRRQDNAKVEANLRFLREHTHAHIHADLIAGLPGESLQSFADGFDRLMGLSPHEIQLGILKRLRGAPIARHTDQWGMIYSPDAPYELLCNDLIDFGTMQRVKRMARYWDMYANSGNFRDSTTLLWFGGSVFRRFMAFADFLYAETGKTHQIALPRQFELLHRYLVAQGLDPQLAGTTLAEDYRRPGRRGLPGFLEPFGGKPARAASSNPYPLTRQSRHLAE